MQRPRRSVAFENLRVPRLSYLISDHYACFNESGADISLCGIGPAVLDWTPVNTTVALCEDDVGSAGKVIPSRKRG